MKNSKNSILVASVVIGTVLLSGCNVMPTKVERVDMRKSEPAEETMGLSYKDFEIAAGEMVEDMMADPALVKPDGGSYVLMVSMIKNDTVLRIDTAQLTKKITRALRRSGKFVLTNAVGAGGAREKAIDMVRDLRVDDEFAQGNIAGKSEKIAPDFALGGKIIQQHNTTGSGKTQTDYYFIIELTNLRNGLVFWDAETIISKRGSSNTVSW